MKKIYLLFALMISYLGLNAQGAGTIFSTDVNGNMMDFRIIKAATTVNGVQTQEGFVEVYGFEAPLTATSVSVSIPESVTYSNGYIYDVTAIGESAFENNDQLSAVVIPGSVLSIKNSAFKNCYSLSNVVFLSSGLIEIGDYAFQNARSLANIEIPNTVTTIGDWAFSFWEETHYFDSGLIQITFGENSQLTSIGESAFNECSRLASINIPEGVTAIKTGTFGACRLLESIDIPENVTSIGEWAFGGCISLVDINIPEGVTSIGDGSFQACTSLASIEIPKSVTSIGNMAFNGCTNLSEVIISEQHYTNVGKSQLSLIGNSAFQGCTSLTKIELPMSLNSIGYGVFNNSTNLNTIIIDADSIPEYIGNDAKGPFYNCPSDMTIYVPVNSVELYKEAEYWGDYTILPVITTPANIEVTGTSTSSVKITWDPVPNGKMYIAIRGEYNPDDVSLDSLVYLGIDSDTISQYSTEVEGLSLYTEYCFSVVVGRANSMIYEKVCGKTLDLPVAAPANVVAEPSSQSSVILVWNAVENAYSYNVYRNNEFVKNVTQVICTDSGLNENTEYCYTVTAVRNETESEYSEEACATTLGDAIEEVASSFDIFPNPVGNEIRISSEKMIEEVSIYDICGGQTLRQQVNSITSCLIINVADLKAGVYFIKVKFNDGEIVKRVVKK